MRDLIERLLEDAECYWGCVPVGVSQRQREAAAALKAAEEKITELGWSLKNRRDAYDAVLAELATSQAALKATEAERDEFAKALSNAQDWSRRWRIRCETAEADLAGARSEIERLREGLRPLLNTAKLLLENSRLCAVQHHGFNEETDPIPGWLVDARKAVDGAAALLSDQAGKAT